MADLGTVVEVGVVWMAVAAAFRSAARRLPAIVGVIAICFRVWFNCAAFNSAKSSSRAVDRGVGSPRIGLRFLCGGDLENLARCLSSDSMTWCMNATCCAFRLTWPSLGFLDMVWIYLLKAPRRT